MPEVSITNKTATQGLYARLSPEQQRTADQWLPKLLPETDKRQPPVTLSPRLLAHLKRWHNADKGVGFVVRFAGLPVASIKTAMAARSL